MCWDIETDTEEGMMPSHMLTPHGPEMLKLSGFHISKTEMENKERIEKRGYTLSKPAYSTAIHSQIYYTMLLSQHFHLNTQYWLWNKTFMT